MIDPRRDPTELTTESSSQRVVNVRAVNKILKHVKSEIQLTLSQKVRDPEAARRRCTADRALCVQQQQQLTRAD